jgi:hypothetical protein
VYILHIKPKRTINQPVIHVEKIELQSLNLSNFENIKQDVERHSIIIKDNKKDFVNIEF